MEPVTKISDAKRIMIESMRTRRQVKILYVRSNGSTTVRVVEPFGFTHNRDRDSYVRSMDTHSGEVRAWRLDRIVGYAMTDRPFTLDVPESAERWTDPADRVAA